MCIKCIFSLCYFKLGLGLLVHNPIISRGIFIAIQTQAVFSRSLLNFFYINGNNEYLYQDIFFLILS